MNHARAAALTRILRQYNPFLSVRPFPATTGRGRVWWTVYEVPSLGPIRLYTLDALDPPSEGWRTPGPWIVDALKALRWQKMVHQAKKVFALKEEEYRKKVALERAAAL